MGVVYKEIILRTSRGQNNATKAPLDVRKFALDLEEAEPRYLFYPDSSTADTVHVLLLQAIAQKASRVPSGYVFDVDAGDGVQIGHEIDATNPGTWTPISGGTRSIVYPIVEDGDTYYVGFSIS